MKRHSGISINLLKKKGLEPEKMVCIPGLLLLLLLGGAMFFTYHSAHGEMLQEQKLNMQLKEKAGKLSSLAIKGKTEEKKGENIRRKERLLKELRRQQLSCLPALREIEKSLPPGIILEGIELENGKITLQGYAPDHRELFFLAAAIKEKTSWGEPLTLSGNLLGAGEKIEFSLEISWEEKAN